MGNCAVSGTVNVKLGVGVAVGGAGVDVGATVGVGVTVGGSGVSVGVGESTTSVGVWVGGSVWVGDGVGLGVFVGWGVAVAEGTGVGVKVGSGVVRATESVGIASCDGSEDVSQRKPPPVSASNRHPPNTIIIPKPRSAICLLLI